MKTSMLFFWEIEQHLSFPMLEILVASAIIGVLAQITLPNLPMLDRYVGIVYGVNTVFLFLTIGAGVVFARSFAGSLGRGEIKLLLSYPIKRRQLFLSKFTALFLVTFAVYGAAFSAHLYLYSLNPFDPMFLVSLFSLVLQLMLVCGVTVAISMVTKNELTAILTSVLLLLGLNSMVSSYLSAEGRFAYIFAYFSNVIHGLIPEMLDLKYMPTAENVAAAIAIPVIVFVGLLVASFVYFTRVMEVD